MKLLHWISIGLLVATWISAVVYLSAPWIVSTAKPIGDVEITANYNLWNVKSSCKNLPSGVSCPKEQSYKEMLYDDGRKDAAMCPPGQGDAKGKDGFQKIQAAEAFAVIGLMAGTAYVVLQALYLFGKIRSKLAVIGLVAVTKSRDRLIVRRRP